MPVEQVLCANPVVEAVLRVPIEPTTLDGVFPEDDPLLPGKTIIVAYVSEAAKETGDIQFVFGSGSDKRMCPFRNLFVSALESVQIAGDASGNKPRTSTIR